MQMGVVGLGAHGGSDRGDAPAFPLSRHHAHDYIAGDPLERRE
jgi:hypothetical protein